MTERWQYGIWSRAPNFHHRTITDPIVRTMQLQAQWSLFCEPMRRLISFENHEVGRLVGCILCVSEAGSIAVIALDGLEL